MQEAHGPEPERNGCCDTGKTGSSMKKQSLWCEGNISLARYSSRSRYQHTGYKRTVGKENHLKRNQTLRVQIEPCGTGERTYQTLPCQTLILSQTHQLRTNESSQLGRTRGAKHTTSNLARAAARWTEKGASPRAGTRQELNASSSTRSIVPVGDTGRSRHLQVKVRKVRGST